MPKRFRRRFRRRRFAKYRRYSRFGRRFYFAPRNKRQVTLPGAAKSVWTSRNAWPTAFPYKRLCKFRYAESGYTLVTNLANGYQDSHLFRGNSIFDPDYTGVGLQPYDYDELTPMYNNYKVFASKICLYVRKIEGSSTHVLKLFLIPYVGVGLPYHDNSDLAEAPFSKQKLLDYGADGSKHTIKLKGYMTTRKMYSSQGIGDSGFTAAPTTNPTKLWNWHFYVDNNDRLTECMIQFDVRIKYYCKLAERINSNES